MIAPITELVALADGHVLYRGELPPGEYTLGREPGCDVVLDSSKVSRRHARLTLSYSEWLIEDLGSSNGTMVAGARIAEATLLFPRQELRLGKVELRLRRLPMAHDPAETMAPQTAAVLRFLPEELRDERRYRVLGLIAMGGMGAVLEAEDLALRRVVAMKVLLRVDSPEYIARFVEEAQITAQLSHPGIVPVHEINVNERDNPFFTMKRIEGQSLRAVLHALAGREPAALAAYPLEELLRIFGKVCDALSYAHSKGVVHRDLKPDNIMVGAFGEAVVMDWGLAKPLGALVNRADADATNRTVVSSARQDDGGEFSTLSGIALGTPQFMSPEQADGRPEDVDARTDIYALGGILYEILSLQLPIAGRDAHEIVENVVRGRIRPLAEAVMLKPPPHLPNGELPLELAVVAMKAMSLEPADRHQTARDLQAAVRRHRSSATL